MVAFCTVGTYDDIFDQDFRQKIMDDITSVKEALDFYNHRIHTDDESEEPEDTTAPDSLAVDESREVFSLSHIMDLCSRLSIAAGNFGNTAAKASIEGGVQNPLIDDLNIAAIESVTLSRSSLPMLSRQLQLQVPPHILDSSPPSSME